MSAQSTFITTVEEFIEFEANTIYYPIILLSLPQPGQKLRDDLLHLQQDGQLK